MPQVPRVKNKFSKIQWNIIGRPDYLNPKSWKGSERIREKIEQDTYRKVK